MWAEELVLRYLPALMLLYWALAAAAAIVALIPLPLAEGFRQAVMLSACRGKLMDMKPPRALGPLSDATVPQAWFAHFYAVGSAWNAAVALAFLASSAYSSMPAADRAMYVTALGLLELHLLRRLVETVGLMRYPPGARMHLIAYLFGLSYYLLVPLTVLSEATYESMWAAAKQLLTRKQALPPLPPGPLALLPLLSLLQLAGIALFLLANLLQFDSHRLLAQLSAVRSSGRSRHSSSDGGGGSSSSSSTGAGYRIPRGHGFELVSCPHYLAEILIYAGLLLLERAARLPMWLMLAWVAANLLLAAGLTQRWYRRQFKSYPRSRRALIPYIY